jgi:FMN phosphatase YigB (HAD superfamily)
MRPMRIFFDVDDTIITWDVRLRPGVHEVFRRLRDEGHELYLWSGYGPRWEVVRQFALAEYVLGCFWKPLYDHHARLRELGVPFPPDFVVDDHPQVVRAFGGYHIAPPRSPLHEDRELWAAYEAVQRFAAERSRAAGEQRWP